MSSLADRVRTRLAETGTSQKALADAAGVKPPSVAQWLNGRTKNLKGLALMKAAAHLGVTPQWLQDGIGKKLADSPYGMATQAAHTLSEPSEPMAPPDVVAAQQILRALPAAGQAEALTMLRYLADKYAAFPPSA